MMDQAGLMKLTAVDLSDSVVKVNTNEILSSFTSLSYHTELTFLALLV